jgi:hypothetical protein
MAKIFTGVKIMVSCPKCETQVEYDETAESQKCTWSQECGHEFKVPKIELTERTADPIRWETWVHIPVPEHNAIWNIANELSELIYERFSPEDGYHYKPFYPQNHGANIHINFGASSEAQANTIAALSRQFLAQFENINDVNVTVSNDVEMPF